MGTSVERMGTPVKIKGWDRKQVDPGVSQRYWDPESGLDIEENV
jgi:hypothetical protein